MSVKRGKKPWITYDYYTSPKWVDQVSTNCAFQQPVGGDRCHAIPSIDFGNRWWNLAQETSQWQMTGFGSFGERQGLFSSGFWICDLLWQWFWPPKGHQTQSCRHFLHHKIAMGQHPGNRVNLQIYNWDLWMFVPLKYNSIWLKAVVN